MNLGYAGKSLKLDLTSGIMSDFATSDYSDRFLGRRGVAAKVYWDSVPATADPFDADNMLNTMSHGDGT